VIEGLQSGQPAFYTKIHHATLDGASGVLLAHALLDVSPTPRTVERGRAKPGEHPSLGNLIGTALKASGTQTAKLIQHLPTLAKVIAKLATGGAAGFGRNLSFGPPLPSTTRSNLRVHLRRRRCRSIASSGSRPPAKRNSTMSC
jgi:hypothetical protein